MLHTLRTIFLLGIALAHPVLSEICDISETIRYGAHPTNNTKFTLAVHHLSSFGSARTNTFTLLGDSFFRGFLLYVLDKNGNVVGKFTSYDKDQFSERACSEETKDNKFVTHRKLTDKLAPYGFEWNNDEVNETVTVQGMVVVNEDEYYNIDPIPFHPMSRSKLLYIRQLTNAFTTPPMSTTRTPTTSGTAFSSPSPSDDSDNPDGGSSADGDPGFLGFGPGTPKGKRPLKDNLLFVIYISCCVILYFVGNALEQRLRAQDHAFKAKQAKLKESQKSSSNRSGGLTGASMRSSAGGTVEMDVLDEADEHYSTAAASPARQPYVPALATAPSSYAGSSTTISYTGPSTPQPGPYSSISHSSNDSPSNPGHYYAH